MRQSFFTARPRPRPRRAAGPARRFAHTLAAALVGLILSGPATAGTLTVIGDVNAGSADNLQLYENVLGGGHSVLFARSFGQLSGVVGHYRALGADPVDYGDPLDGGVLATADLLVLTTRYNTAFDFTDSELAAIRDRGRAGGATLLVAEAGTASVIDGYNALLGAIGASIRFSGARFAVTEVVNNLPDTPVTAGLSAFRLSPHNTLVGGTTAVRASNGAAIAFETLGTPAPIPLPGAGPLMATGVTVLCMVGLLRRRRPARVAPRGAVTDTTAPATAKAAASAPA